MPGTFTQKHSFRRGCLGKDGRLLLLLVNDELARGNAAHTSVVLWDNGRFRSLTTTAWTAAAVVLVDWPDAEFAVVGEQGQLLKVRSDGGMTEEHVFATPPKEPGGFKGAACVDGRLIAAGTGFWCAVVAPDGTRRDTSPRQLGTATEGHGAGFESVGGASLGDLVAVGWDGAIWHFDGERWEPQSSPVNRILSHVICRADGEFWACGQSGTLVRGRRGQWRALQTRLRENLWSLAAFCGGIVAASTGGLFRFELDNDSPQAIGLDSDPSSFYWLDAKRDEVLLSTGNKNVVLVLPDREIVID
ncbi:hypothetical protein [Corallococcus sp. Z5C101001]|uniref:hypothetical protein n=1 Tax=Corallococcus sp. Z5C101001 TaxID=2596829 RepID=UPI0011812D1C|nr:hypothetical protein [Corallococcus sp. Z5C101001]TSC23514.1 hypothetical protein FOF48_28545 [Corallococcus sp. Z5C101001]